MNLFKDKKKLIQVLFGLAFLFLLANIIVDKITARHFTPVEIAKSGVEINFKFRQALSNYGLLNTWIKEEKRKKKDDDSLLYKYNVEVPKDLPIALLLNEIYDSLSSKSVIINSREVKIGGETIVKIFSGDNLKLQAKFNYNEDLERPFGSVGLLIEGFAELNDSERDKLLRSPEKFTLLIVPSKDNRDLIEKIISNQKEAAILISDENTDLEYKMKAGFSRGRIENCIKAISADFAKVAFLVIDDNSGLYSSPQMKIIREELDKRNIKYFNKSKFRNLLDAGSGDLARIFRSDIKTIKPEGKLTFLLSPDQFNVIQSEISKFRKTGYKFVGASQNLLEN